MITKKPIARLSAQETRLGITAKRKKTVKLDGLKSKKRKPISKRKTYDGLKPENIEFYRYFNINRDVPLKQAHKIVDKLLGL